MSKFLKSAQISKLNSIASNTLKDSILTLKYENNSSRLLYSQKVTVDSWHNQCSFAILQKGNQSRTSKKKKFIMTLCCDLNHYWVLLIMLWPRSCDEKGLSSLPFLDPMGNQWRKDDVVSSFETVVYYDWLTQHTRTLQLRLKYTSGTFNFNHYCLEHVACLTFVSMWQYKNVTKEVLL